MGAEPIRVRSRRRAIVEVSPEILVEMCKATTPMTYWVSANPLPPDATCIGAEYDAPRDVWRLGVESESFPEVPAEEVLPVLPPPEFTRKEATR